jgi:hypothetical protein
MTFQGRVQDGVVVLSGGALLPDGTLVNVTPVEEGAASRAPQRGDGRYPVSEEKREASLKLIGLWRTEPSPGDQEVDRIIEETRTKKYG